MGMTPTPEQVEAVVSESLGEMDSIQRIRLEHYARSKGLTPEQEMAQIVSEQLIAEGADVGI